MYAEQYIAKKDSIKTPLLEVQRYKKYSTFGDIF